MTTQMTTISIENDPRWAAVVARDPKADGQFVYAVKTTGIYCNPSSLARLPKPENVEFFDTAEQARTAGYRPSKRASKDQSAVAAQHAATVAAACRRIESTETPPALAELAEAAGLSSFHFHRVFKAVTGLTPRGYAAAHRSRRVRERLADGGTVTDALYEAGFNSNSRFYEAADHLLGISPAITARAARTTIFVSPSASAHSARFWWRRVSAECARFCWAMIHSNWSAICRTGSGAPI